MAAERLALPPPDRAGAMTLAEALVRRRSIRAFAPHSITQAALGQLLWAAQGESDARDGVRTAPSAGALYPLVLYAATAEGVFRYVVAEHALERVSARDSRGELAAAALGQTEVAQAPCVLVVTAVVTRTTRKYGERGERYVYMEAGHAAQNALLAATALGLAACPVGAFEDPRVVQVLKLGRSEAPLYLAPVGAPKVPVGGQR